MANAYTFTTHLEGFENVVRDAGKYNNRCFSYKIDEDTHDKIHGDRWELIRFAKDQTKAKKPYEIPPPWDDELCLKYTYSAEEPSKIPVFLDAEGKELDQGQMELVKRGSKVELYVEQKPFLMDTKVGKTVHARVGTVLRVKRVRCLEIKPVLPAERAVGTVQKQSLINPMDRTLSDLVGSAVVFDLQQLLETYLPVVGNEGRNQLIQTTRTEAMEYLDQEMI